MLFFNAFCPVNCRIDQCNMSVAVCLLNTDFPPPEYKFTSCSAHIHTNTCMHTPAHTRVWGYNLCIFCQGMCLEGIQFIRQINRILALFTINKFIIGRCV